MASMWSKKASKAGGGKRFGLVKKQGSNSVPAIFGGGADDDAPADARGAMNRRLQAMEASSRKKAAAAAADVDPSIYDYDGVYDQMKADESAKISARVGAAAGGEGGRKTSRYIGTLKQAAKVREREFDRVYERQLLKEQEEEKAKFGDTERYVTAAYKQQLQESRKWDAEDARAAELEEQTSASSAGMHGFYANLLTKNIGMGADVDKAAVSSYTHGSKRNARMEPVKEEPAPAPAPAAGDDDEANAARALSTFDENSKDDEAQAAARARAAFCAARGYADVAERLANNADVDEKHLGAKRPKPEPEPAAAVDSSAAALSAKERFLARKRAKQGA